MAQDSQWPVEAALFTKLKADATLTALLAGGASGIYDHVPQDSAFPYIVVGETGGQPGEVETKDKDGFQQSVRIHCWSRLRGQREIKEIMGAIADVLDNGTLTVTGHTLVKMQLSFSTTFTEEDGVTRHGVQDFDIWTQGT